MASFNSIIGALRVVLGLDTAAFDSSVDKSKKKLQVFGVDAQKAAFAAAAAFTAAAGAIAFGMNKALASADQLGKAAQSIGMPVEALSALKHAADLSGVSLENLSTSVGIFSKKMTEAATDASSDTARAFDAIGVAVTDAAGQLRPTQAVMEDIAAKFAGMQDGAGKTALALALFGKSGAALIPLLNAGRSGLKEMTEEARELGLVIDGQTARQAERFNDTLHKIGVITSGIFNRALQQTLPALNALAERYFENSKNANSMRMQVDALTFVLKSGISVATLVAGAFQYLGGIVSGVASAVLLVAKGQFQAAFDALKTGMKTAEIAMYETQLAVRDIWSGQNFDSMGKKAKLAFVPIIESSKQAAEALRAFHKASKEAFDLIISDPLAGFSTKMAAAEQAVRGGTISMSEFEKTMRGIKKENRDHWDDLASTAATALTTIFGDSKAAAIAAAVINTGQGITKALATLPPPFSFAQAALTAAMGAAQIAKIRSTSVGSSGSAPSVSSAAASATPAAPPAAAGPSQTITVSPMNPMGIFTGDMMRAFAERLLEYQRNGGQIVWATR